MKRCIVLVAILLAACGRSGGLQPAPGQGTPPPAYGETRPPDTGELLTPSVQARPQRGDELLRSSERRRSDEFDLPPR